MLSRAQIHGAGRQWARRHLVTRANNSRAGPSTYGLDRTSASGKMEAQHSPGSVTSAHRLRSQSTQAALHQSTPVRAEAVESSASSLAFDNSSSGRPEGMFKGPWGFPQPGRTKLPTPLPPEAKDRRSVALRNRLSIRSKLREGQKQVDDPDANSPMAFGDLTMATLNAINADASYYTPTHMKENVAMLRACLSTGLIARASKIFNETRSNLDIDEPATAASVNEYKATGGFGLDIYNAMIGAYMRKAWQDEDSRQSTTWVQRAWTLFDDMNRSTRDRRVTLNASSVDPRPDAATYAVLAMGIVRLLRTSRYSSQSPGLNVLLANMRRNAISAQDVILSPVFSQEHARFQSGGESEADARSVLQQMISAAADLADSAMSAELHETHRLLSRLERQADADVRREIAGEAPGKAEIIDEREELLPVRSTAKPKTLLKQSFAPEPDISFNLQVLRENLSIVEQAKRASADAYERQKWLEFSATEAAQKRFDHLVENMEQMGMKNASVMRTRKVQTMMWEWYGKLEKVLTSDIERLKATLEGTTDAQMPPNARKMGPSQILNSIYPFLKLVPPKKMALITVLELIRMQGTGGVVNGMKTAQALISVGKLIEGEAYASQIKRGDGLSASAKYLHEELRKSQLSDFKARTRLRLLVQRQNQQEGDTIEVPSWTFNVRARVGSFLIQRLMSIAKIHRKATDRDNVEWDEEQPVFYSAYQYIQGRRLGVIKVNDEVAEELNKNPITSDLLQLRLLPMLVPPKPWLSHDSGGYYSVKSRALRYKEVVEQSTYLRHASDKGDLNAIYTGLDVLGSTAWTINEDIFKVMTKVWNSGKSIADMPPLELDEKEPERPADYDTDIRARGAHLRRLKMHGLRKAAVHSQRCDANYKLEVARAYVGERFFFPHNLDFRGRAYCLNSIFNHIGDDMCRGLLKFHEAKPLGSAGLRWLRIQVANVFGFDKASFSDREAFTFDHADSIRASATDPLGKDGGWWLRADDPWQCLAACKELTRALNHPEGPENYPCGLPVHQDGTCNGLQHYAALGGDLAGAKQVNLSGGDRPSDVYTGVAELVIKAIDQDASKGNVFAEQLVGKITRKVVKQTVMTTVYGVTYIGAKQQIERQLAARGDIDSEQLWQLASYLAAKVMGCIGDLFKGADSIKTWLTESALLIAKSIPSARIEEMSRSDVATSPKILSKEQMTAVIWTTPLGLPVVQPYRKTIRKQVSTVMQTVYLHDPQTATQVAAQKQSTAFPPNFIHSLDSVHMFLTALECSAAGMTFASVHDSYWTHACDVPKMNDAIRDTFIRLHGSEILKRLRDEFLTRYSGFAVPAQDARKIVKRREKRGGEKTAGFDATDKRSFIPLEELLPPVPERGTFDVEAVRQSLYFFS